MLYNWERIYTYTKTNPSGFVWYSVYSTCHLEGSRHTWPLNLPMNPPISLLLVTAVTKLLIAVSFLSSTWVMLTVVLFIIERLHMQQVLERKGRNQWITCEDQNKTKDTFPTIGPGVQSIIRRFVRWHKLINIIIMYIQLCNRPNDCNRCPPIMISEIYSPNYIKL